MATTDAIGVALFFLYVLVVALVILGGAKPR